MARTSVARTSVARTSVASTQLLTWIWLAGFSLAVLLLAGCGTLEIGLEDTLEPGVEQIVSPTPGALQTVEAETSPAIPTATKTPVVPDIGSDAGHEPTPVPAPTEAVAAETPANATPTLPFWTPSPVPPPGQGPSPTPVAPLPGLVYNNSDGLWWVTAAPVFVTGRRDARLSPDGLYALYLDDDDIWLLELATGVERNLTGDSGRVHCCAQWWPARPGTIIFGSWPADADLGPSTGFLSAVEIDGSDYRVLDEEAQSNGLPGPGPDGQTIAYDRGGTSWLFRWESGSEPLDPTDYGLFNVVRIGGPSWSPDGEQIAWTVAITDPEWRIAVAVIDLSSRTAHLLHPYENAGRGGWFPPPAWSPDGRWLAYLVEDINRANRGVWVVSVDGDGEAFLGPGSNPIWSPDGRFLTFTGISETGAAGETVPWLVDPGSWYEIPLNLPPGSMVVDWVLPASQG